MITFLVIVALLAALGSVVWFFGPQVSDTARLKRQNARVVNLTKQTKRDMDNLARRQRNRDGW